MSGNFVLLAEQNKAIQKQNELLIRQFENLKEQFAILTQHRFGAKTESSRQITGQLFFDLENACNLNEAEVLAESEVVSGLKSMKLLYGAAGRREKRDLELKDIEVEIAYGSSCHCQRQVYDAQCIPKSEYRSP